MGLDLIISSSLQEKLMQGYRVLKAEKFKLRTKEVLQGCRFHYEFSCLNTWSGTEVHNILRHQAKKVTEAIILELMLSLLLTAPISYCGSEEGTADHNCEEYTGHSKSIKIIVTNLYRENFLTIYSSHSRH
jgi:hypothetical protein